MAKATNALILCLTVALWCALPATASASISAPPKSHVLPTADGRHVLVFLAPFPSADKKDEMIDYDYIKNEIIFHVKYPASGCYEIGSNTPLWTAPWDDTDGWTVSEDCRYLVRWNIFGDGAYQETGDASKLDWGLKFYDRGKEIARYNVAELVDFPPLMPLTSADWHLNWIDYVDGRTIENGVFAFQTSTHEKYRFDVATGEIIEQSRMWRTLARTGIALLTMAILGAAVWIQRRQRVSTAIQHNANLQLGTSQTAPDRKPIQTFSYSLRTLLLTTTVMAVLCIAVPRWPHILLLISVLIAALLTRVAFRYRRSAQRSGRWRVGFILCVAATGFAWCCCYLLSVAPVLSLVNWLEAPDDVRMAIILTVYRPVWILNRVSPEVLGLLTWYSEAW